jgi:methanogenic corrinoid protein MtbC1
MTTILDLSDNPQYTIKTVCNQTGILPVTLRAWERRHEVLNPHRSENRYRLYSDRDVAVLRWIKSRVDNGISISSAIIELRSMQKNQVWPEVLPPSPGVLMPAHKTPPAQYATALYQALVKHDEGRAGELMREANAVFDLITICTQVLVPCLVSIGDAWYRGDIRVTTEHFASNYLRGKLLSLMQTYPSRRNGPCILVGCAPTEYHEIGSLMFAALLRSRGYRVEFLGPDVPLGDLVDYARDEKPDMIVLSASMEEGAHELTHMADYLNKLRNPPIFCFAGPAFQMKPRLREQVTGGVYLGETLEACVEMAESLLKAKNRSPRASVKAEAD